MKFPSPLVRGTLLKRYKRFLADIQFSDGREITAHVANPGAMLGLNAPGAEVWLSKSDNPKRKLAYSWELIKVPSETEGGVLVGLNTAWPNPLAAEALAAGKIEELQGYNSIRREVKYGVNSRIDLLLTDDEKPTCYVEVKNVHLKRGPPSNSGVAEFPDCRTERGAKHLRELTAMVAAGHRAVMLYVVQRGDCDGFTTADDLDPVYGQALRQAMAQGVEAICYDCRVTTESIDWGRPLPVQL